MRGGHAEPPEPLSPFLTLCCGLSFSPRLIVTPTLCEDVEIQLLQGLCRSQVHICRGGICHAGTMLVTGTYIQGGDICHAGTMPVTGEPASDTLTDRVRYDIPAVLVYGIMVPVVSVRQAHLATGYLFGYRIPSMCILI